MFDYGITYEEEMEIVREETWEKAWGKGLEEGRDKGLLEAALKLVKGGISLQEVVNMLDLSDNQIGEIEKSLV